MMRIFLMTRKTQDIFYVVHTAEENLRSKRERGKVMAKEVTLRGLLKRARGESALILPGDTAGYADTLDTLLLNLEQLEKRIEEKMEKEMDSYGYSFLFRFCDEILGNK